ncbi:hypothetical protein GCM10011348_14450 [Marinobacterium nitratireducens]|uniref:Uncharacterized protein n=1 Tax=Marinobacterium nitratireducens TaxID=518897 RepID=A0A917ZBR1_9GAMM|nr:hypothetical protein [Marinobacterium nitratireducens]GGO79650.1 hypothetical protein GCM10011348_14450 [Marinobacterium nitratireducens]
MQRLLLVVTIALAVAAVWLFLDPGTGTSPGTPQISDEMRSEARSHIDSITADQDRAIGVGEANNFVTASQLLRLPEGDVLSEGVDLEMATGPGMIDAAAATAYAVDMTPLKSGSRAPGSRNEAIGHGTLPQLAGQITLRELLDNPEQADGKIFYIHAVNEGDREGLWGILNTGLINTFAEGLDLPRSGGRVQVEIPHDADQRMSDSSSSYLGRILDDKVRETYIYNYRQGLLGQDPDLIQPGQQLVVISFSEDELVQIYNHFASLRDSR